MAANGGAEQGAALPPEFVTAHSSVVADKATQFTLTPPPEFKPPEWLNWLKPIGKFFEAIGPYAGYIFWGFLALVVGMILFYILREMGYLHWPWRKVAQKADDGEWVPDAAPARALLAEADALAAAGRFEEAAHLLLLRSVEDIGRRRPAMLRPSSTAREISQSDNLPEKARNTFTLIARHVEASLFGGRALNSENWMLCRDAYGRFALAGEWR